MTTKQQRLNAHNTWPASITFSAEENFRKKLLAAGNPAMLNPIQFKQSNGPEFHRYLSLLLDGFDVLPERPDHCFDHFFKIIDSAGKQITGKTQTTETVNNLHASFFQHAPVTWEQIVDSLMDVLPTQSCEYIVKRILTAATKSDLQSKQITTRAESCLGKNRYKAMQDKFLINTNGISLLPARQQVAAASFFKKLMKQTHPLNLAMVSSNTSTSFPDLDLSNQKNLLTAQEKLRILLSLLLFTMRNERSHGSFLSPFRSSTAKMRLYASYYYATHVAYIAAIGAIHLRGHGQISCTDVLDTAIVNTCAFRKFFGANA